MGATSHNKTKRIELMNTEPMKVTGAFSALELAEVIKRMAIKCMVNPTNALDRLRFASSEVLNGRFTEEDNRVLAEGGYKIRPHAVDGNLFYVEPSRITCDIDTGDIVVGGKINLGDFLFLNVRIQCGLRNLQGTMDNFSFDRRCIN